MAGTLSDRQSAILSFIKKQIREKGYPPAVREIGRAVGLSSSSTVHAHLEQLEAKGYLRRDPTKPRAIEVVGMSGQTVEIPLVGKVTAGEPILAVQNIEETLPFPRDLVRHDNVFMLSVRGDSMYEAGIYDGDYVLVRQQNTAQNGEIVVALLDDEATVKHFFKDKNYIRLQPANPRYEPILSKKIQVLGKVIGVYRNMDKK